MSVGEILSARTWMQAPSTSLYTFTHPHTISGFYGISGSMICLFQENDIKRPKVIGLCKLFLRPLNLFRLLIFYKFRGMYPIVL